MDSYWPGADGIRFCGGPFWPISAASANDATNSDSNVLWIVAVVRHSTDRGRGNRECLCRLATPPTGSGVGSRQYVTLSFFDAGCSDCFLSGVGRTDNGDLSG